MKPRATIFLGWCDTADTEIETSVSSSPRKRYDDKSHVSRDFGKTVGGRHRYGMAKFLHWMANRNVATLVSLLEAAEYFNPGDYNPVFEAELRKVIARIHDADLRQQVSELKGFDWAGYLERSLRRAGFRDDEVQEHFHQIAIRLLVKPGRLFSGWQPGKHGPLERRFRKSVWNAIRNAQEKSRNRRKRMTAVDPTAMASQFAGRQPYNNIIIGEFRQLVARRLGRLALTILDQRLEGRDTKDLIGTPGFTVHSVKREVQAVKELAQHFASRLGDPGFARMVATAMEAQSKTVAKRQQTMAARRAAG